MQSLVDPPAIILEKGDVHKDINYQKLVEEMRRMSDTEVPVSDVGDTRESAPQDQALAEPVRD